MEEKKYYLVEELPLVITLEDLMPLLCFGQYNTFDLIMLD